MTAARILHLHGTFNLGGKEARTVQLMNIWGDRAHHSVLIGAAGTDNARNSLDPSISVDFPQDAPSLEGKPGPIRYLALARYMQRYDLVLTYNWGSMDGVMAHRMFSPFMRLPRLIHHEDGFNEDEAASLKPIRNRFRTLALPRAYAVVVPSRQLEAIALNIWHQPRSRVRLIPNGIDVDRYLIPPVPDAIPGFSRTPGKLVLGTIAGLRPVKNLRRLVRAVAPHRNSVQLVIVGTGDERAAILDEASICGLTDLYLAGFVPEPWRYAGLFDIFALSSNSEQFPISLVEAMAAGLPVASTDVGDVMNMVAADNQRFVVPPGDEAALAQAIGQLAANSDLRAAVGAANRAKAQAEYAQDKMVQSYAALYGQAMAMPDVFR